MSNEFNQDPNQNPYQQSNQPPFNPQQPQGYPVQPNQQPNVGANFNPQQPFFAQPPMPPVKKKHTKRNVGCLVVVALIVLIVIISVANSGGGSAKTAGTPAAGSTTTASSSTPKATAKPLVWTTVKTFKGNGSLKTDTFSAPSTWKLSWTCDPTSFNNIQYNVVALIEDANGTTVDSGVNAMCKPGTTSGSTNVTSGGVVRLNIISEGDWVFNIQEQK